MIFNLHIQNGELVSIPMPLIDGGIHHHLRGVKPVSVVTPDGEFLLDSVRLNGTLRMEKGNSDILQINAVNQICDSVCPVVLFTPRFGKRTLTSRCYEFTLRQIKLPLIGKYKSRFVVTAVNPRGNSTIPADGVVLAIEPHLGARLERQNQKSTAGTLEMPYTQKMAKAFNRESGETYDSSETARLNPNSSRLEVKRWDRPSTPERRVPPPTQCPRIQ